MASPTEADEEDCCCCNHEDCADFRDIGWCCSVYGIVVRPYFDMHPWCIADLLEACLGDRLDGCQVLNTSCQGKSRRETMGCSKCPSRYTIWLALVEGADPLSPDDMRAFRHLLKTHRNCASCAYADEDYLLGMDVCPMSCCVVEAVRLVEETGLATQAWLDQQDEEEGLTLCQDLVRELGNADAYQSEDVKARVRAVCRHKWRNL